MSAMGQAVFVDIETTGLDPMRDEMIELAIISFIFRRDNGKIESHNLAYLGLSEPGCPIPKAVTAIHGISDDVVAGCVFDQAKIRKAVRSSEFLVAHNASFDRAFLVRQFPWMTQWPWLCSMRQIDWHHHGFARRGLGYLCQAHGLRFVPHRAAEDALAGIRLLGQEDENGRFYLAELLPQI